MQQLLRNQITIPVEAYPSDLGYLWNRAWVRVQTPSTPMPDDDTWAVADIDRAARTTTVAAPEGATEITHSTFGIVPLVPGNQYIIDPTDGSPSFIVTCGRLASSSVMELQDPLPQPVPVDSAIRGYRVSKILSLSEVSTQGTAIARWRVEDRDRISYVWDQPFLILNTLTNYHLNSSTLERIYPMVQRMRPDDLTLEELIETAWTNYLRPDLEGKGIKANQIKSWERLDPAHAAACVYHLVLTDERQEEEYRQTWRNTYAHQCDLMYASVRFWYDEGDGTTPARSPYDYSGRSIFR